ARQLLAFRDQTDVEGRAVRRPFGSHHLVARGRPAAGLHQLLKPGLVVLPLDLLALEIAYLDAEQAIDQQARGLVPAVARARGDARVESAGQDRLLGARLAFLRRLAETQMSAETDLPRGRGQRRTAHEVPLELGETPLVHAGEATQKGVGDQEAERGV